MATSKVGSGHGPLPVPFVRWLVGGRLLKAGGWLLNVPATC